MSVAFISFGIREGNVTQKEKDKREKGRKIRREREKRERKRENKKVWRGERTCTICTRNRKEEMDIKYFTTIFPPRK